MQLILAACICDPVSFDHYPGLMTGGEGLERRSTG